MLGLLSTLLSLTVQVQWTQLFHSCRVRAQNYIMVVVAISSLTLSYKIMQGSFTYYVCPYYHITYISILTGDVAEFRRMVPGQSEFQKDSLAFATLFNEIRLFDSGFCMWDQCGGGIHHPPAISPAKNWENCRTELRMWQSRLPIQLSRRRMVGGARHAEST